MTVTTRGGEKAAVAASEAGTGDKRKLDTSGSPPAPKARKKEDEEQRGGLGNEQTSRDDRPVKDEERQSDKNEQEEPLSKSVRRAAAGESAVEPHARVGSMPSNILEKGIIYFFFRGRVNVDEPQGVGDIARSYIVLRPVDKDAKLGRGPIGDAGNSRLCAIPKKTLPQSGRDRWIAFVEKAGTSFDTLKETFLTSSDYATKTSGTSHRPAATPVGEGVYAITSTGRESHLAYMLTIPEKLGEVQREIGLKEKGSFIISTRNPEYPAPKTAQLPGAPEYPKGVIDEFRSLRWLPTKPKHLDFAKAQFLLIGESSGIRKAVEPTDEDKKDPAKDEPVDELENLEDEDKQRMAHLSNDDSEAIFADLETRAKDYPKLQTTF